MAYIREYDGLRGIMAIWVLLGHWATSTSFQTSTMPSNLGNTFAVDVFIILSGFAIAALLSRSNESYGEYIVRRIFRIFPVYWFYLTISVASAWLALDVWQQANFGAMREARADISQAAIDNFGINILTHLPAMQAAVPSNLVPHGEFAFLGQAWSISLEWQFYLIAPLAIGFLSAAVHDWRPSIIAVLSLFLLTFIARYFPTGFIGNYTDKFVIGIGTYYFLRWNASSALITPMIATSTAILITGAVFLLQVPSALPFSIWALSVGAVLSAGWGPLGAISKLLTHSVVQSLGKISYSVYLAHMIPLTLGMYVLHQLGFGSGVDHAVLLLIITLIGTFALSLFSFNFIEMPFQALGKRLSKKSAAPS